MREGKDYAWVQKNVGQLLFYCEDILQTNFYVNSTPFSWKLTDLLDRNGKYAQYIKYLEEKCKKELHQNIESLKVHLEMKKDLPANRVKWKRFGEKDEEDIL